MLLDVGVPPPNSVQTQDITSPFFKDDVIHVELLVPTFTELAFHWYCGFVYPFWRAVKVIVSPLQILYLSADIVIWCSLKGIILIVTVIDVAGLPVVHWQSLSNTQ